MCAGTLQEGSVIQQAYNFNLPLRVIETPYSGKCMAQFGHGLPVHQSIWTRSIPHQKNTCTNSLFANNKKYAGKNTE